MKEKFYITTAIAYPNGKPHMWHALEIIIADAMARMYRMTGENVEFQTGTDEHGIKNRRTAQEANITVHELLDKNVKAFEELYDKLKVSYDTFLRTSDSKAHYPGAQKLWELMEAKWDIYKKAYTGLYCVGCEAYKTEKDLIDGKCPDHPTKEIEHIEEENYFFRLEKYKKDVMDAINEERYKIVPESRKNEILSFLENAKDVSFSRPKSSLPWGIPVPNDPDHVMYVRCDALSNYITGQGYGINDNWTKSWPADVHIIGKDILRFHAAFWPAMLMSADIELPKELLTHGFLNLWWAKMGKSTGNVVDPSVIVDKYGRDALSFTLMYDIPVWTDGEFSEQRLKDVYNSMLIWAWWNLVNRVTKLSEKYWITTWIKHEDRWVNLLKSEANNPDWSDMFTQYNIDANNIKDYLESWYVWVNKANEFIQNEEPWKKYKAGEEDEAKKDLEFLLWITKQLSVKSAPILVDWFEKLKEIFGNKEIKKVNTDAGNTPQVKEIFDATEFDVNIQSQIIYPRVEDEK